MKQLVDEKRILLFYVRFFALALSPFLYLFLRKSSLPGFIAAIVISLAFTALSFINMRRSFIKSLAFFIFVTFDFFVAMVLTASTGGIVSPFVPYLVTVILTTAAQLTIHFSIVYTALAGSVLLAQAVIYRPELFKASFFALFPFVITAVYLFPMLSTKTSEAPAAETEESPDQLKESIEDVLWAINDLQRELHRIYKPADAINAFLDFLQTNGLPPEIILVQRKYRTIKYFTLSDSGLSYEDAAGLLNPELKKLPEKVVFKNRTASLAEQTSTLGLYLFYEFDEPVESATARLASSVFTYYLSDVLLTEASHIYMSHFASLEAAIEKIGSSAEPKKVIEGAAESIKKMTGIDKVVIVLASTEDEVSLDPERTVIKGKYIQHPEEFWRTPLIEAGKRCLKRCKPVITSSQKGSATIICVPINLDEEVFGFISGISSVPEEEIATEINTIEIISALTAVTLKNIQILEEIDREFISEERKNLALDLYNRFLINLAEISFKFKFAEKHPDVAPVFLHRAKAFLLEQLSLIAQTSGDVSSAIKFFTSLFINLDIEAEIEVEQFPSTHLFYQVIFESLLNAFVHGRASKVKLSVYRENSNYVLKIIDNGTGFDIKKVMADLKHSKSTTGLKLLFVKIKDAGGSLKVSSKKGHGTTVTAILPETIEE